MITREPHSFVGRRREAARILAALEERSGIRFVEVIGPGGIGKTTLLEEVLRRLPSDVPVLSVTERDPYDDPAGAMLRMAERFLLSFGEAREFRPFFRAARLHRFLARGGLAAGAIGWIVPRGWARDPEGVLTDSFLGAVGRLFRRPPGEGRGEAPFAGRAVVFALDGYERAEPILTRWLHLTLLPRLARPDLPYEPKVVFSGREPLAARDQSWEALAYLDSMVTVPLAPLDPADAGRLVEAHGVEEEAEREAIVRLCAGHPLWLSLAAHQSSSGSSGGGGAATRAQVVKHLERRILRWVEGERQRRWIRAAAHLDWFDRDALRVLLGEEAETAYEWLAAEPSLLDPAAEKHAIEPFARNILRAAVRLDSESLSDDLRERAETFHHAHDLLKSLPSPALACFVLETARNGGPIPDDAISSLATAGETEVRAWLGTESAARLFERGADGLRMRPEPRRLIAKFVEWSQAPS